MLLLVVGDETIVGSWRVRSHVLIIDKNENGIFRAFLDGKKVADQKLSENGKEITKFNTQMWVESV